MNFSFLLKTNYHILTCKTFLLNDHKTENERLCGGSFWYILEDQVYKCFWNTMSSCFSKLPESILQSFLLVLEIALVKIPLFSFLCQPRKKVWNSLKIIQAKKCQTQASAIRPFIV